MIAQPLLGPRGHKERYPNLFEYAGRFGICGSRNLGYDATRKVPVSTICVGMAASMGSALLSAGAKGKRFILPNAEVMLHQIMGGVEGQASDIEISAKHILKLKIA